jgi:hypothetical protein
LAVRRADDEIRQRNDAASARESRMQPTDAIASASKDTLL